MTRLRILAALSAAVLALGVLPASAQDPVEDPFGGEDGTEAQQEGTDLPDAEQGARFIATADGGGFDVQLAEEGLTIGQSNAGIQSASNGEACDDARACANAAGEALLGETASVAVTEGDDSADATAFELDQLEPLATASIGRAAANASVEGSRTVAEAQGGALDLELSLTEELLGDLGDLEGLLEELLGGEDGLSQDQLDELISELEGQLELNANEIGSILEESGLSPGAQTQSGEQPDTQQIAEKLVDAHNEAQQDDGATDGGATDGGATDGEASLQQEQGDEPLDGGDNPLEGSEEPVDGSEDPTEGGGGGDEVDTSQIQDVIDSILNGEGGDSPEGPEDLLQAIQDLLEDPTGQPLLTAAVGPTDSVTEDDGSVTTASARSQGVQVVLVPTENSTLDNPEGLVSLQVGTASASVSSDRNDPTADFDPALARLRVTNPLTGEIEEVSVEPGQSDCAGSEPLILCVSVGDGSTTMQDGGASATANAVSVSALGDPLPELSVDLAAATAGVNAADAPTAPQEAPQEEVEARGDLPETGGGMVLPGLALLGAGAAGFAGLRRKR